MPPTTPPPEESAPFREVFARECEDIRARRESYRLGKPANPDAPPADLKGLALSGGGIRSATFCLGILQRLQADGMLKHFDYLSTVSGGGFIGGWWSAWLAREERTEIFPPAEGLETERGKWASRRDPATAPDGSLRPEGSRNAGIDPVHHLRLFANYLTPRKGALSGDTWRAITVVSRNLFLTILMLVPLLGAAILASQFYFTANHNLVSAYACDAPAALVKPWTELAPTSGPTETPMPVCPEPRNQAGPGHLALIQRVAWLSLPLLVLAGALLLSLVLWMLFSIGRAFMAVVTAVGVTAIFVFLSRSLDWGSPSSFLVQLRDFDAGRLLLIGAVPVALMAAYLLIGRSLAEPPPGGKARPSAGEVLTNRMTRLQSIILVLFTVLGVTLVFGGFAHEAVRFAFQQGEATLGRRLAQTGGWLAVVWAGAGALFTGLKAAPTGGADNHPSTPSRASQLVFAVTPPLVLVVLLMLVATVTHAVLSRVMVFPAEIFPPLILAFFIGILICCIFGTYEFWTDAGADLVRSRVVTWAALGAGAIAMAAAYFLVHPLRYPRELTSAYVGLAAGIVLAPWLLRALLALLSKPSESADRVVRLRKRLTVVLFTLTPAVSALMGWGFGRIALEPGMPLGTGNPLVAAIAVGGITFTATFVLLASVTATRANHRMLTLLGAAALLLGPMLMQQFLKPTLIEVAVPTAIVALVGIVLGSIIGLGWMLDPNYLSLHTFYRARLVRAYLGASNPNRRDSGAEISDSADGDDVLLANLRPTGPCHLINATLNLVGGRDLTTAQRSAAYFTMSRHYCGSLRTGYRPTSEYMKGQLSLGSAVAISGAAASPNMGSKTPSAALAMLMALLNVRLGFWAPTPNQARWQSPRPRLWPFYLLREFLSQTNDLSLYCYLTDGGHFDNTGLYALVQRGCRHIVFVDCGADPAPCFSDLGDAIRRCRIDFGTEIDLQVGNFRPEERQDGTATHFVVGSIMYSRRHALELGWGDKPDQADRTGTIVWIKPSLLRGDSAEVRQYGLENMVFPQQSTADQWFDEAQFESYRRLGEISAREALANKEVKSIFA